MGFRSRNTDIRDIFKSTVDLVQSAEDANFDGAWFAEHHFSNYCICPSPLLMVSHCAAVTKKIRLGPAVLVVPLYQPIRLLEEIAMASHLCSGRFDLGIGSGYQPFEFDRFGEDLSESKSKLMEFIELLYKAYGSETFYLKEGESGALETAIGIRPSKTPPIWIAGDSSDTHHLAARRGYTPIITGRWAGSEYLSSMRKKIDTAYKAEGFMKGPKSLGILRFICITKSKAETHEYLENVRYQLRLAVSLRNRAEAMDGDMMRELSVVDELTIGEMEKNLPVGDAETVASRLIADIQASGASHVMLNIQAGASNFRQSQNTISLFSRDVRPIVERSLSS